ncbi:hypothetical protein [Streptomyces lavendofoliae]|uniref:Uncharacterized protein n=1 Tax=Streptomyces lavendofoliae TaxID=67314 RepID=A0A918I0H0_9ACTN|nr:hypothetical protein [Streptomyces lavendofoliae]GGU50304.1 hypothetical protein GCM10010274_43760 [Streptomyces lavendofoliae]
MNASPCEEQAWTGCAPRSHRPACPQVQDDLNADDVDARELAALLREPQEDIDVPGLFSMLSQVVSTVARRAEQIEPDRDGDASCPLHDAAALITDNAGQRLNWAARALDPQGDVE